MLRIVSLVVVVVASTACTQDPGDPIELSVSDGKADGQAGAHAILTQANPDASFSFRCNEWFSCAARVFVDVGDGTWKYPTPTYALTIDVFRESDRKHASFQLYAWKDDVDNVRLVTIKNDTELDGTNDIVAVHSDADVVGDAIKLLSSDREESWDLDMRRSPWGSVDKLPISIWATWE